MKTVLVVLFFGVSVFAQDPAAVVAAESACGPTSTKFDVKPDATQHPTAQPDPGKALVYVVEDLGECPGCIASNSFAGFFNTVDNAVTKVGMDGTWMGANRGSSYIFFATTPGGHHLCMNWQSRLQERSRAFAMANFTAEDGKVYYFRERVFPGHSGDYVFELDPVNSDEGKYLVAISPLSVSHPKK
ncbi:MAG TPA: hypothetical protein VGG14_15340 [Candidatus Sulfotelmatobacter sp.]|jgi:hypothetical protein